MRNERGAQSLVPGPRYFNPRHNEDDDIDDVEAFVYGINNSLLVFFLNKKKELLGESVYVYVTRRLRLGGVDGG